MIVLLQSTSFGTVYQLGEMEYCRDKEHVRIWIADDPLFHIAITPMINVLEIAIDKEHDKVLLSVPDISCITVSANATSPYFRIPFVNGLSEHDYIAYFCLLYTCEYGHTIMEQPYGIFNLWVYDMMCQATFSVQYPDQDKTIYPCLWILETGETFREEYTCTVIQPTG